MAARENRGKRRKLNSWLLYSLVVIQETETQLMALVFSSSYSTLILLCRATLVLLCVRD
jgi:hypothetical protein